MTIHIQTAFSVTEWPLIWTTLHAPTFAYSSLTFSSLNNFSDQKRKKTFSFSFCFFCLLFCWWLHGAASGWIVVRWKRRESTKAENSRKLGERGERERDCEGGKEKSTREGEGEKVCSQSNQSCLQCYNFFFWKGGVSEWGRVVPSLARSVAHPQADGSALRHWIPSLWSFLWRNESNSTTELSRTTIVRPEGLTAQLFHRQIPTTSLSEKSEIKLKRRQIFHFEVRSEAMLSFLVMVLCDLVPGYYIETK